MVPIIIFEEWAKYNFNTVNYDINTLATAFTHRMGKMNIFYSHQFFWYIALKRMVLE